MIAILSTLIVFSARAESDASVTNIKELGRVFDRSEQAHQESMASIMKGMTVPNAVNVLEKHNLYTPALAQVTGIALKGKGNTHLRKQPVGYSGIDGARQLLNDMIFESMSKYDAEIAKCTEYYSKQCAGMEACRGQIAASNYIAANSRTLILTASPRSTSARW